MSRGQNRFGSLEQLVARYHAGASLTSFSREERVQLATRLSQAPAYRDPKNAHHERVSADVRELFELSYPGTIGAGGEVVAGGAPAPDSGSLFR